MKKNKYLIFFVLTILILLISLLLINNNYVEKFDSTGITQEYDIIIVAGQSNAIGSGVRNVCDSTSLPGCSTVNLRRNSTRSGAITNISNSYDSINSRIKQFSSENAAVATNRNKIIDMSEPLQHFNERTENKVSFAFHFAKEYLARTNTGSRHVLIVGCAWSGSGMFPSGSVYWRKPDPTGDRTNSLCEKTVQRLQNLKDQLAPNNNSKVVAFLWHQGESNSTRAVASDTERTRYKSALKESLTDMRTRITAILNNSNSGYTYPILLGGLSYDKEFNRITNRRTTTENRQAMSQIISEVSNRNDPNFIPKSAFVSSDAITVGGSTFNRRLEGNSVMDASGNVVGNDDNSHFSATACREFGKRYFFYYNQIK